MTDFGCRILLVASVVFGSQHGFAAPPETSAAAKPTESSSKAGSEAKSSTPVAPPARPTMQKFSENLAILMQNLNAFDNNPSKEVRNKVIQALGDLKGLSHNVQPTMALYAVDPVMRYLSYDLPKQFGRIEAAYTSSNYSHARYLLRQTTQYCIGCHASSSNKNSAVLQFPEALNHMSELEKAEYFSATRRHEEAMLIYEKVLSNRKFKMSEPEIWEKAVKNLIAITIRIRTDAHITLEMLSAFLDEGGYSPAQTELLQTWRASAKAWTSESWSQKLTGVQRLGKVEQLIAKGDELSKKAANLGYIEYMRAMTVLNELSMSTEADEVKAKAFRMTGLTSEKLRENFVWMHPEAYYEACIRIKPHSEDAKDCMKQLSRFQSQEKDQVLERDKLQQLQELAR